MRLFRIRIVLGGGALALAGACTLTTTLSGLAGGEAVDGGAGDAAVDVPVADAGQDRLVADAGQDGSATSVLGCGAADAGLLAYWPMDEGLGTAVADCSGHGLDGTILGAGTWVAGRRPTTKAILFDATSTTFVNIPASALADSATTITLAAWVSLGLGQNSYVIHKGQPPEMSWSLEMEADTGLSLYISTNGTSYTQANAATGPISTWFHLAAVYEAGTKQTLYVNGISVKSVAASATMFQKATPMKIGWYTKGMIDEVRVFSRALSANEISALASE